MKGNVQLSSAVAVSDHQTKILEESLVKVATRSQQQFIFDPELDGTANTGWAEYFTEE